MSWRLILQIMLAVCLIVSWALAFDKAITVVLLFANFGFAIFNIPAFIKSAGY